MPCTTTHKHGLATISGYVVRRTFPGTDIAHQDVVTLKGADAYAEALHRARLERQTPGQWAVIDPLYVCGCRGQG